MLSTLLKFPTSFVGKSALSLPTHTESDPVPPYPVCEEKKCVDVATSDLSTLAPDSTDWTSGDRGKVMRAAGCTGGASPLTCTLDVGYVSVSLVGILPNCSAASCVVDDT